MKGKFRFRGWSPSDFIVFSQTLLKMNQLEWNGCKKCKKEIELALQNKETHIFKKFFST